MRTQEERDEQTLEIATALGLFILVLAVTVGALAILDLVTDVSDGWAVIVLTGAAVVAGFAAFSRLVRASRR